MHSRRGALVLCVYWLIGYVYSAESTKMPVEVALSLPLPRSEVLLLQEKIQEAIRNAAQVDLSFVSVSKIREISDHSTKVYVQVQAENGPGAVSVATKLTLNIINSHLVRSGIPPAEDVEMLTTIEIINEDGSTRPALTPSPAPPSAASAPSSSFPTIPVIAGGGGGLCLLICFGMGYLVCAKKQGRRQSSFEDVQDVDFGKYCAARPHVAQGALAYHQSVQGVGDWSPMTTTSGEQMAVEIQPQLYLCSQSSIKTDIQTHRSEPCKPVSSVPPEAGTEAKDPEIEIMV